MNKILLSILTLIICSDILFGQDLDYKRIRQSLATNTCGKVDSADVYKTRIKLETLDTTKITKDIDYYYRDLAWCYYRTYMRHEDTTYLKLDIDNYLKSLYHKPNDPDAFWSLSFAYYRLGDCTKGKKYLDLYKTNTDQKFWNNVQIERMSKNCK